MLLHVSHLLLFPSHPSLHQQHSQQLSPPPSSLPSSSSSWPSSSPFPGVPPPTPQQHRPTSSISSISRSISKVRTRRIPSGGTTASRSLPLSSSNTHTMTTKTTKTSCLFFVVRYMRAPLLCVCPPSVSLVVIYNTYMLLAKILLSLLPTTYDTIHTHGEINSTNISHHTHVHLNTHTISHTHLWKEDHKDRDLKYYYHHNNINQHHL